MLRNLSLEQLKTVHNTTYSRNMNPVFARFILRQQQLSYILSFLLSFFFSSFFFFKNQHRFQFSFYPWQYKKKQKNVL